MKMPTFYFLPFFVEDNPSIIIQNNHTHMYDMHIIYLTHTKVLKHIISYITTYTREHIFAHIFNTYHSLHHHYVSWYDQCNWKPIDGIDNDAIHPYNYMRPYNLFLFQEESI